VRHATSPSRRDQARQVVIPNLLKIDRRRLKTKQLFSRYAARSARLELKPRSPAPLYLATVSTVSYLSFFTTKRERVTLRNLDLDTEHPYPYRYGFELNDRLESVANAHTAADLHVRPGSQSALVLRAVGAANDLRDTACLVSRNENDSAPLPAKTTWRFTKQRTIFVHGCKVLNLCGDSKHSVTVIFRTSA
jgi:hypothetical protein